MLDSNETDRHLIVILANVTENTEHVLRQGTILH